jgi:S1-C subfamily serine protease
MKKETFIIICGALFLTMMIIAAFNHPAVQTASAEMLHEIKTADVWQGAAYVPVETNPQNGALTQIAFPNPNGAGGSFPQYQVLGSVPQDPNQPAALPGNPVAIDPDKPVLIKKFGAEVEPVTGGKVKITGIMGNSWAEKAKLQVGDILLSFDAKEITDIQQFQDMVTKAAPEMNFKLVYYRNGRKMKGLITLGEGEMDGFTPIVPVQ